MPPTITSIAPSKGHTGGATLVEISGTGFRLTPAPADTIPAPKVATRMRVSFGGTPAIGVEVIDATTLLCVTPIHDPGPVDVLVQAIDETPARVLSVAEPFVLAGQTLTLQLGIATGGTSGADTQTLALPIGTLSAVELAALLNAFTGVSVIASGGRVQIQTDMRGTAAMMALGGPARPILGFLEYSEGGTMLEDVPGESTTLAGGFTFARPDLQVKMPPTLAIEALLVELERQIIPNVHVATDSDFDAETGDLLNTAYVATVPALILADLQMPESTLPISRVPSEETTALGTTLVREPEDLVDIMITVIGVSDSPIEAVNLMGVCRRFFRKNQALHAEGAPEEGYVLAYEIGSNANITAERDGNNLHSFTMLVTIRAVPVGDMPIRDQGAMPTGVPAGTRYESVTAVAFPQTEAPSVGVTE